MKRDKILNAIISCGFLLYFLILLVERVLALILSVNDGGVYALTAGTFIGIATYVVTAVAVVAALVFFFPPFIALIKTLFSKELYDFRKGGKKILLPSMILLFAGMMHTGFTLAPVQFGAYGCLILSMIIHCVDTCLKEKEERFSSIVSLIYLTLFSMAIPVCYAISDQGIVGVFYYISEFLAVFALIPFFSFALKRFFETGKDKFCIWMLLTMVILDAAIIVLKWNEEINFFLLIFASASLLFYCIFFIPIHKRIKAKKTEE